MISRKVNSGVLKGLTRYNCLLVNNFRKMSSKGDPKDAKVLSYEPLDSGSARWIKLEKIVYKDPRGAERTWEMAARTTRQPTSTVDAVAIVAIIKRPTGPELVLQKQFRPPVDGVCIEMPAGLVDPNESIEVCALRELKEETGYIGEILSISPPILNDPGFTNTNLSTAMVSIDLNDERNKNPIPELEDGEFIETFTLPLKGLVDALKKLDSEGFLVDARIYNFALGIQLSAQLSI